MRTEGQKGNTEASHFCCIHLPSLVSRLFSKLTRKPHGACVTPGLTGLEPRLPASQQAGERKSTRAGGKRAPLRPQGGKLATCCSAPGAVASLVGAERAEVLTFLPGYLNRAAWCLCAPALNWLELCLCYGYCFSSTDEGSSLHV